MRSLAAPTLALCLLALTACGSDYSDEVRTSAEDHCETIVGVEQYENPDGWDRCVDDNLDPAQKLQDCLDEDDASDLKAYLACNSQAGWSE